MPTNLSLKSNPNIGDMTSDVYYRRVYTRSNGSMLVYVPIKLIPKIGWKKSMTIKIIEHNGLLVMAPPDLKVTKKELSNLERAEKIFDEVTKKDREGSREKKKEKDEPEIHPKISMLEKLRVK